MAEYLLLIYDNEKVAEKAGQEGFQQMMKGHQVFGETNEKSIRGGHALQSVATATSVRPDPSGDFTVTDAPFAETKEALGGYYLVEAANLDEAISLAKQIPTISGGVEVRPIKTFD